MHAGWHACMQADVNSSELFRGADSRLCMWTPGKCGPLCDLSVQSEEAWLQPPPPLPGSDQPFSDFSSKTLMRGVNPGRARPGRAAAFNSSAGKAGTAALNIPDEVRLAGTYSSMPAGSCLPKGLAQKQIGGRPCCQLWPLSAAPEN